MQNGRTPLHDAASRGHSSTAKVLLEAGADVMARDVVSSCVVIARDLSDVCYSRYGKRSFCSANYFFFFFRVLREMMMMTT